jgi:uncharacterized protein
MSRLSEWIASQAPTPASFENNRFLRPFAKRVFHPSLWRFNRRSVPRGVGLGLLVGIFLLIPGVQIVGVALLALPLRANIPIGAAMTFLSMPLTTPFILAASVYTGNLILDIGADAGRVAAMIKDGASISQWINWLFSEAAPALVLGLAIISVVAAIIGYFAAKIIWRWRIARKWKNRGSKIAPSDG